jgi:outer membrane protein assembly factor BamD (BamD/ComL family)
MTGGSRQLRLGPLALLAGLAMAAPVAGQEAAERLLLEAARSEQERDIPSAMTDYEMVARQFPGTEVAGRALLRLVDLKRSRGDVTGATEACDRLIDDFPGTSYAAAGLFYTGEMQLDRARKRDETTEARETFRRIWLLFGPVEFPDLIYRAGARVRNAELDIRAGDLASAELSYLSTLEGEPMSEWTMRARLGLARIYLERGDWALAAETFQQAINEAVSLGHADVAAEARLNLTLAHRLMLRPAAGEQRWQTGRAVRAAGVGRKPAGVAATGDGRVLVVDEYPGRAVLLDGETVVATRAYEEAYRPFFARDGRALVPSGTTVWDVESGGQAGNFMGPSKAPVRRLNGGAEGIFQWFTFEQKPNRVLTYRTEARMSRTMSEEAPIDIATDGQGRLHVLGPSGVARFNPAGEASTKLISGGFSKPIALDVDPMGNVYVLDLGGQVDMFDARGQKLDTVGPAFPGGITLGQPVDLAVDGTGRIFLLDARPGALYVLE